MDHFGNTLYTCLHVHIYNVRATSMFEAKGEKRKKNLELDGMRRGTADPTTAHSIVKEERRCSSFTCTLLREK